MALTTRTKVKDALGITVTDYDNQIENLLTANFTGGTDIITSIIERYVDRILRAADYKLWIRAHGGGSLFLDNYPINSVSRVSTDISFAGTVKSSVGGSHAFVRITSTGITYTSITAGVATSNTTTWASKATLALVAADAPANWTVTIESQFQNYPSNTLKPVQSAPAEDPEFYQLEVADYDAESGVVIGDYDNGEILIQDDSFPRGAKSLYIEYNAGYTEPTNGSNDGTVPADLEDIANQMVWNGVKALNKDRTMESEKLGDYSYKRANIEEDVLLTPALKKRLNTYRKINV